MPLVNLLADDLNMTSSPCPGLSTECPPIGSAKPIISIWVLSQGNFPLFICISQGSKGGPRGAKPSPTWHQYPEKMYHPYDWAKFYLVVNALLSGQKNVQTKKLSGQKNCQDKKIVRTKKLSGQKNCPDKKNCPDQKNCRTKKIVRTKKLSRQIFLSALAMPLVFFCSSGSWFLSWVIFVHIFTK